MKTLFHFCCVLALAAGTARAGIVLDEAPQDVTPTTTKPLAVPKPKDGATTTPDKGAPTSDVMRFANKDVLHGTFLAFDKGTGVRWQSLESKDAISFQTDNLTEVKLDSHRPPANTAAPTHSVLLTNNDELPGALVSLDEKSLVLDTWYAGKITIPRAMVKGITPLKTSSSILYEGPTGMEGWVVGQNGNRNKSWTYRDGALIATSYGTIGRDMKLPDLASIEFDLISRGNSQMSVCIYCDQAEQISNCYMFQINNNYIYLQRYSRNGSNMMGDQQPVQLRGAVMGGKMHMDIRVNKTTKTIYLYVNGAMVKQWTDTADFAGTGTKMIFSSQQGMYAKLSNIKVRAWDGKLDTPRAPGEKSKEDVIKMENQDKVSGKLKKIEGGKAIFTSSYADLTIPLDRIEQIDLSGDGADEAKKGANDVRAYFADRGSITMELESWDAKSVTATSPNFGKAVFSPDAFQKLQFNLGKQTSTIDDPALEISPDEEEQ